MSEPIRYPDFDKIVKQCKVQMQNKFERYGNSWTTIDSGQWWKNRLVVEVNKVFAAQMMTDRTDKLHDVINICAMMIENYQKELDRAARITEAHKAEQK